MYRFTPSLLTPLLHREVRQVLSHIRRRVDDSYVDKDNHKKIRLQSVTVFCFLRFIVPAIMDPNLHGLDIGMCVQRVYVPSILMARLLGTPPPAVSRSLRQIGKVIQALANMNAGTGTASPVFIAYRSAEC